MFPVKCIFSKKSSMVDVKLHGFFGGAVTDWRRTWQPSFVGDITGFQPPVPAVSGNRNVVGSHL